MALKREKFTVVTGDGTGKCVSGLTLKGIGLHRSGDECDSLGHYRWAVTHLNSGLAFRYLNVKGSPAATYIGDLIVNEANWAGMANVERFLEKYPELIAALLGIKHRLDANWIGVPDPASDDPARVVWLERK